MSSKSLVNFSGRFPLLDGLARILCFVVFPLIFINYGLDNLVENHARQRHKDLFNRLSERLDLVEFYADNGRFAHHLLKQAFGRAEAAETAAEEQIAREIQAIRQAYPQDFTFVVADSKGNILPHLSDENSYRYLYRQAFSMLDEVLTSVKERYPGYPELVQDIDARLGRFRSLVGPFVEVSSLSRPFLGGRSASAYLASASNDRFYVWYQTGTALNMIVFVSRRFINGSAGAKWIIDKLNRELDDVSFGHASYPFEAANIYPKMSETQAANSLIALGQFENVYPQEFIQVNKWNYVCQIVGQHERAFGFVASDLVAGPTEIKAQLLAVLAKAIFVIFFVFWVCYFCGRLRYGLRFKLAGLFLYAVLLPGVVVAMFLLRDAEAREQELVYEEQGKNFKLLQRIDEMFPDYLESFGNQIAQRLDTIEAAGLSEFAQDDGLVKFRAEFAADFGVQAIFAVDGYQKDFVDHRMDEIAVSPDILNAIGRDIVKIYSSSDLFAELDEVIDLPRASKNVSRSFLSTSNGVQYLGMADSEYYTFMRLLDFEGSEMQRVVIILFWSLDELQQRYLRSAVVRHKERDNSRQLVIMNTITERVVFSDAIDQSRSVTTALESLHRLQSFQSDRIKGVDGEDGILVALRGDNLTRFNLAAFSQRAPLEQQYLQLRNRAILFIALLVVIAAFSFYQLHRSLIIPVGTIKKGILALEARDFRHRIAISGENELGKLALAFNRSLENLQELQVASIVQESLLPEMHTSQQELDLLCYGRSMTSLDGDFYEVIKPDDQHLFVFIGDSTGHGVPASLNMAMAKAVAVLAAEKGFDTEQFLTQLNEVFVNLRKSGSKDYMTGQCAFFDSSSGQFSFYNAGHCYPLIVEAEGRGARFLKHGGLPLGFSSKFSLNPLHAEMAPGDTIMFYSDGIVEAVNDNGIQFGFDRLQQLAAKAWNKDSEVFLNNILSAIDSWATSQQDDYTILFCRRKA